MNDTFAVQTGKGARAYDRTYEFDTYARAKRHYDCIHTHSGYKKRLVRVGPDGSRLTFHRYLSREA